MSRENKTIEMSGLAIPPDPFTNEYVNQSNEQQLACEQPTPVEEFLQEIENVKKISNAELLPCDHIGTMKSGKAEQLVKKILSFALYKSSIKKRSVSKKKDTMKKEIKKAVKYSMSNK